MKANTEFGYPDPNDEFRTWWPPSETQISSSLTPASLSTGRLIRE
jgi:hypothetical protein